MATMQDVATLAHVSLSTVSYAINNTRPISAATRERIERAMVELDFRPNAIARSLASRRSRILALTFPGIENRLGSTVMEFVTSAAEAARARGYHLVVWPYAPVPGRRDVRDEPPGPDRRRDRHGGAPRRPASARA